MPNQSSHISEFRSSHKAKVYLSLMTGGPVLTGTVSSDPATENALTLAYTLDTGDAADVLPGYRVMIYDSSGNFKGRTSVRFAGTLSSTSLPIRELSWGEIQVVSGDTFTVYDEPLLTDKLVAADVTFAPDHATYTDQNSNPEPIATSGGWWAGWLGDSGTVDIEFDGSGSYTVDPDSGGTLTHAWACASGTWDDDTAESPTLTLSAAGKYTVFHTVTDDDNSKTSTQVIRVRVHDANDPPYEAMLTNNSMDATNGAAVTLNLFEDADIDTMPDGAPVIVWQQQYLGGAQVDYGAKVESRSHIVIFGFLRRDRSSERDGLQEIEFEIMNPLARLGEIAGYSKVLLYNSTPADWQNIKGLTVKRAIIHILRNYTNITQFCDFVFDGFVDASYPAFYVQKATPLDQIRELADARGSRVICDRTGRIEVQLRQELTPLYLRSSLPLTLTLSQLDVIDFEVSREHFTRLETHRVRGFKAATNVDDATPYFARYPASPARGTENPISERMIFDDTNDLYYQTAMRGAWENRVYYSEGGVYAYAPELRLTLFGGYAHLFQFYRETVLTLNLDNMRGVDLTVAGGFYWMPTSVTVDYAEGTATTTLVMQALTHAPQAAAVDDTPATETQVISEPAISYAPVVSVVSAATPDAALLAATDTIAAFTGAGKLHILTSFLGTPSISTYDLSATTGSIMQAVVDAYSPGYTGAGTAVNAWLLCQTKIVHIADIFGTRTLTVQKTSLPINADSNSRMQFERGTRNWGVAILRGTGGGIQSSYSLVTQNGTNWTSYDLGSSNVTSTVHVSPHRAGRAYTVSGASGTYTGQRSTNYGVSFSALTTPAISVGLAPTEMHVPYQSTDDSTVYVGTSVPTARIYKVVSGTQTDVSPVNTGSQIGTVAQFGIKTYDGDSNTVLVCGNDSTGGKNSAFLSSNGASSWTQIATGTGTGGSQIEYWGGNIAGDSASVIYLWGWRVLALSTNGGSSFTGKLSLTNDSVVNIMGAPV